MSKMPEKKPRLNFGLLLALSFLIFAGVGLLDQTIRWTDRTIGFQSGLVLLPLYVIIWCTIFFPWSLIIYGLNAWKGYFSPRTAWVLAPSALMLLVFFTGLILEPPTPYGRFKTRTGADLPSNIQDLRAYASGGGFADIDDYFYFRCTPEETRNLIEAMELTGDGPSVPDQNSARTWQFAQDFTSWPKIVYYSRDDEPHNRWYTLITNEDHTEVYIRIYSI